MLALLRAPSKKFSHYKCYVFISISELLNSYLPLDCPGTIRRCPGLGSGGPGLGYATVYKSIVKPQLELHCPEEGRAVKAVPDFRVGIPHTFVVLFLEVRNTFSL